MAHRHIVPATEGLELQFVGELEVAPAGFDQVALVGQGQAGLHADEIRIVAVTSVELQHAQAGRAEICPQPGAERAVFGAAAIER